MDTKRFLIILVTILMVTGVASAVYSNYVHSAIKIGDGKDINLNNQVIGNGALKDVTCTSNCTGFTNASTTQSDGFTIWKDGINYYSRFGNNGSIYVSGTDGNSVISNTISACANNCYIVFAPGNYNFSGSEINISKPIHLKGSGINTQIYQGNDNTLFNLTFSGTEATGTVIEDVFLGSNATSTGTAIIKIQSNYNTLSNIVMSGGYYGIYLHGAISNNIKNLRKTPYDTALFYCTTSSQQYGIYIDDRNPYASNANQIINPIIKSNSYGIYSTSTIAQTNNAIIGGDIESNTNTGIYMQSGNTGQPSTISNTHLENNSVLDINLNNAPATVIFNVYTTNITINNSDRVSIIGGRITNNLTIAATSHYTNLENVWYSYLIDYATDTQNNFGTKAILRTGDDGNGYIYNPFEQEFMMKFNRGGVDTYNAYVRESSAYSRIQTASMKGVSSGIMGISSNGNITLPATTNACITMKSPDGTAYKFQIANGGTVNITTGTCV